MPHIHEKIDFVVEIYIVFQNKVLLRIHDKYKTWLSPGGHIELDDDPNAAAVREAKEEVGLDVTLYDTRLFKNHGGDGQELIPPMGINRHRINETHEHISFIYFGKSTNAEFSQGETEVSEHIKWFTKEELENNTFGVDPRVTSYALKALELLAD